MRLTFVLICLAVPISPQGQEAPKEGLPPELRSYFGLNDQQEARIAGLKQDCQLIVDVEDALIQELRRQIAIQTEKPVLHPVVIGPLYAVSSRR